MEREKLIDAKTLEVGDRLSRTQYYKVISKEYYSCVRVENEYGFQFNIDGLDILEHEFVSADQFAEEEKVSRTELAEILMGARDSIFTVCFLKQVKTSELTEAIEGLLDRKGRKRDLKKDASALAKKMIKGEERELVGYLLRTEPKMGRSLVVDLEVPIDEHRIRLVDHRTLQWIIFKNKKYIVKR